MPKIKAGIINVTGYIGIELARLLRHHPRVELVAVTGRSAAGHSEICIFLDNAHSMPRSRQGNRRR